MRIDERIRDDRNIGYVYHGIAMRNYYPLLKCLLFIPFFLMGCGGGSGGGGNNPSNICNILPVSLSKVILGGESCESPLSFGITKVLITTGDGSLELCSGSLIGSKSVLTAAHCLIDAAKVDLLINSSEEWLSVPYTIHPNYRRDDQLGALFSDVAIVHIPTPSSQAPIALNSNYIPHVGEILRVFGFGRSTSNSIGELSAGNVAVNKVTQNHIYSVFEGSSDNPCFGDSGGPAISLISPPTMVGIVSSGSNDSCSKGDVTLYTNLAEKSVRDWIKENS